MSAINSSIQVLILAVFFILLAGKGANGLKCHQCSGNDTNCEDPFRGKEDYLMECGLVINQETTESIEANTCHKNIVQNVLARFCGYVAVKDDSDKCTHIPRGTFCECYEDGCNHASTKYGSSVIFLAVSILLVGMFF